MTRFVKACKFVLALMLIRVFLCQSFVYSADTPSLRIPMIDKSRKKDIETVAVERSINPLLLSLRLQELIAEKLKPLGVSREDVQVLNTDSSVIAYVGSDMVSWIGFNLVADPVFLEGTPVMVTLPGKALVIPAMSTFGKEDKYKGKGLTSLLFAYLVARYDAEAVAVELAGEDAENFFYGLESKGLIKSGRTVLDNALLCGIANKGNALEFLGIASLGPEIAPIEKEDLTSLSVDRLKLEAELCMFRQDWDRFNRIVEQLKSRDNVSAMVVSGPYMKNRKINIDEHLFLEFDEKAFHRSFSKAGFQYSKEEYYFLINTLNNIYPHVKDGIALAVKEIKTSEIGDIYSEISVIDNGPGFSMSIEKAIDIFHTSLKGHLGLSLTNAVGAADFSVIHIPGESRAQNILWSRDNKKVLGTAIKGYFVTKLTNYTGGMKLIESEVVESADRYVEYFDDASADKPSEKIPLKSRIPPNKNLRSDT